MSEFGPFDGSATDPGEGLRWRWLFADVAGVVVAEPDVAFDDQGTAEDWLGDNFQDLADDGIASVTLMDGEHVVYGPMSLAPEDEPAPGTDS